MEPPEIDAKGGRLFLGLTAVNEVEALCRKGREATLYRLGKGFWLLSGLRELH